MKPTDENSGKLSNKRGAENPKKPRKKLNLDELLTRVVELFNHHSPHQLTFSKVARFSKVPRSTLYYYFGNDFSKLIGEAVRFGMSAFINLYGLEKATQKEDRKFKSWEEFQTERLIGALELVLQYPWAPTLYFRYRGDAGNIGKTVRDLEEKYLKHLAHAWKRYKGSDADPLVLRLTAYVKLGLMYGIATDSEVWSKRPNYSQTIEMISKRTTAHLTKILEIRSPL